jgi:hypothetical protein
MRVVGHRQAFELCDDTENEKGTPVTAEDTRSRARRGGGEVTPEHVPPSDDVGSHKLQAHVGEQVLHALGEPGGLLKVQVRPLWEKYYRVNVFVGANAACATIAHSYFVVADGDGNVLDSVPKVRRQY